MAWEDLKFIAKKKANIFLIRYKYKVIIFINLKLCFKRKLKLICLKIIINELNRHKVNTNHKNYIHTEH